MENGLFRPTWYSKESCLKNAYKNFGNLSDVEWLFVHDGPKTEWLDTISSYSQPIIRLHCGQNQGSLIELYKILKSYIGNHDSFYLLEDDFLHIENSYEVLKEALTFTGLASLYDHVDRYTRSDDINKDNEIIYCGTHCHYRTAESTTGTFAGTRKFLDEFYEDMKIFNKDDRDFFRHCIAQGTRLVTPIPSFSTHCHTEFGARLRDWEKINNE